MEKDIDLDSDLEETGEAVKSGLKIRTNLKAGALTLGNHIASSSKGYSEVGLAPQLDMNVLANINVARP